MAYTQSELVLAFFALSRHLFILKRGRIQTHHAPLELLVLSERGLYNVPDGLAPFLANNLRLTKMTARFRTEKEKENARFPSDFDIVASGEMSAPDVIVMLDTDGSVLDAFIPAHAYSRVRVALLGSIEENQPGLLDTLSNCTQYVLRFNEEAQRDMLVFIDGLNAVP